MIAVDAMGGDYAPQAIVAGALKAAQSGIPILLCGDSDRIKADLTALDPLWSGLSISIESCTQVIDMAEEPSRSVLRKRDASLVRAAYAVKEGRAKALVSAGNSGAVLAAGVLIIGRTPGVLRPALGNMIPTPYGGIFCLDLGANTDCKAEHLNQFAVYGSVYVEKAYGIAAPRVALLSNGHEPYKGSQSIKEAYALLEKNPHITFFGNLESRDMFEGKVDVLVTDGFVGNILLKGIQGTVRALFTWVRQEASKSFIKRMLGICAYPLISSVRRTTDYQQIGGALLLGIEKPVVVAHGSSQADAMYHAIVYAQSLVQRNIVQQVNDRLSFIFTSAAHTLQSALSSNIPHAVGAGTQK